MSHVSVRNQTEIGADCVVHPFVALGSPPQDFKYKGGDVSLVIGDRNTLREHVTMHLGTETARGITRVGEGGYFMVGAHVGHDCIVGDNVVFANNATLGGEVVIGDYVIMGGLSAIHQKCRVGRYAFVGGGAPVTGGDFAGNATGMVGGGESIGLDEHAVLNAVTRAKTPAARSWNPDFVCNGPKNS